MNVHNPNIYTTKYVYMHPFLYKFGYTFVLKFTYNLPTYTYNFHSIPRNDSISMYLGFCLPMIKDLKHPVTSLGLKPQGVSLKFDLNRFPPCRYKLTLTSAAFPSLNTLGVILLIEPLFVVADFPAILHLFTLLN